MISETGRRRAADGTELATKSWRPDGESIGIIAVVHGYLEYGGRFERVAEQLVPDGFEVHTQDMRGHGLFRGRKGYVRDIDEIVQDTAAWIRELREAHPDKPFFLLGNSLGGAIAALLTANDSLKLDGVILVGAVIKVSKQTFPWLQRIARLMGAILPRVGIVPLPLDHITKNPAELKRLQADPFIFKGAMHARTGAELMRAARKVWGFSRQVSVPLLVMHGECDMLADVQGAKHLFSHAASSDKTLRVYPAMHHDLFAEEQHYCVYADLREWLHARMKSSPQGKNSARDSAPGATTTHAPEPRDVPFSPR